MGFSEDFASITGYVLLFCLVFGMSATVDIDCMYTQMRNRNAILTAIAMQFFIMPFVGYTVVNIFQLDQAVAVTLLVITTSPGGSYSNWWCSLFNADLALSVTMTAASTLFSVIMLPINLLVYTRGLTDDDVANALDWRSLFTSIVVVISAISLGLFASSQENSHNFNVHANRLGNAAGFALISFSVLMSNSDDDSKIWQRDANFYIGVGLPCVLSLLISNLITSLVLEHPPERVATSIECCYQNIGIAMSVALAMFQGDDLAAAMGVPLFYGTVEGLCVAIYCVIAWKINWTKAPPSDPICTVIGTSYEVLYAEMLERKHLQEDMAAAKSFKGAMPSTPTTDYVEVEEAKQTTQCRREAWRKSGRKMKEPSHVNLSYNQFNLN